MEKVQFDYHNYHFMSCSLLITKMPAFLAAASMQLPNYPLSTFFARDAK
jgi:hypothetical protein